MVKEAKFQVASLGEASGSSSHHIGMGGVGGPTRWGDGDAVGGYSPKGDGAGTRTGIFLATAWKTRNFLKKTGLRWDSSFRVNRSRFGHEEGASLTHVSALVNSSRASPKQTSKVPSSKLHLNVS